MDSNPIDKPTEQNKDYTPDEIPTISKPSQIDITIQWVIKVCFPIHTLSCTIHHMNNTVYNSINHDGQMNTDMN